MGFSMFTVDVPVTKTSSSILAASQRMKLQQYEPTACINCGRCVEVCPSQSDSIKTCRSMRNTMMKKHLRNTNGLECMECGSCSYVCPAKRQSEAGNRFYEKNSTCKSQEESKKE